MMVNVEKKIVVNQSPFAGGFILTLVMTSILLFGCSKDEDVIGLTTNDAIYQISSLNALLIGDYAGRIDIAKLLQNGLNN